MKTEMGLITLFALALGACAVDYRMDGDSVEEDASELGTMQLSLTGMDAQMQQYRLRAATFAIEGTRYTDFQAVSMTVSSDTELDSPTVRTRLFYGYYSVSLRPGEWYIERLSPNGDAEPVAEVVLLSAPTQSISIQQGAVTQIAFQFGVDGELIDFVGGDLEIGIGIVRAPGTEGGG
jgi:hypothetical protein